MALSIYKEKYSGKVGEVVLGATKEQGGTRSHTITVGGETALPFLHFEGDLPNRPVVALEIWDMAPVEWHPCFKKYYGEVFDNPGAWAEKCVEEYKADLVLLRLKSADPDLEDRSPEECVSSLKKVLGAVGVPLIVLGCGKAEKDNQLFPKIAEAAAGENLLLGVAELEQYKTITSACIAHNHSVIAQSPIDINICKQLNILIAEMSAAMMKRTVIDPTIAALGYGIEYSYSIMERARLGALQGDKMLAMPMIGNVGYEVWKAKEANISAAEAPRWGGQEERAVLWEASTAMALLQGGMDILVMRHPQALKLVKQNIEELMKDNSYD
ncbi:MAG: CO dehydrogenase/acetyl-CoA synthase subunit delta [Dethiobacteria bacterium]|nr:acetyl-CoA decarbonylase/synthase complex subunit delta [Bacillota bacterium]